MNRPGPSEATRRKMELVWEHLGKGEKLTWALAEVRLGVSTWYRWAGWQRQPVNNYRREVYLRRELVPGKVAEVEALRAKGWRPGEACKEVGLSYFTWYHHAVARPRRASA